MWTMEKKVYFMIETPYYKISGYAEGLATPKQN
jgi:hypothetical protein